MKRTRFQQGLDDLKQKLLQMGGMAESAIEAAASRTFSATRSFANSFSNGRRDQQCERAIDELALDLLAMQQPMAVDLRFIVAVLKINSDIERVGDQAVNIAQRTMDLLTEPEVAEIPVDIARMTATVLTMMRRALESFLSGKAEVATAVLEMDNIVDRMKDEAFVILVQRMKQDPKRAQVYLDILLITRNLERWPTTRRIFPKT